jgi:hypothetical protein
MQRGAAMIRKIAREHRGRKRTKITVPASYSTGSEKEKSLSGKASIADVSDSGVGLYSEAELPAGMVLEIECDDLWDSPKKFVVKWSNRLGHNFFRIGLSAGEKSS